MEISQVPPRSSALPKSTSPKPADTKPSKPAGWWDLMGKEGTIAGVLKVIEAATEIPDEDKVYLRAKLSKLDPKFNFVTIDAHFHLVKGAINFHLTITPSAVAMQLTLSEIRMDEATKPDVKANAPAKTPVQQYYDANTREEKAAVVKKYPELENVFSAVNHN